MTGRQWRWLARNNIKKKLSVSLPQLRAQPHFACAGCTQWIFSLCGSKPFAAAIREDNENDYNL
jgi:hypothetical protein